MHLKDEYIKTKQGGKDREEIREEGKEDEFGQNMYLTVAGRAGSSVVIERVPTVHKVHRSESYPAIIGCCQSTLLFVILYFF